MYLENGWKRLHIVGKSSVLDREPSTQYNHTDFMQFLTSTDVQIRKLLVDVWLPLKNPSENSQWYIKNDCSDVA